jgi:hypothetical protein
MSSLCANAGALAAAMRSAERRARFMFRFLGSLGEISGMAPPPEDGNRELHMP